MARVNQSCTNPEFLQAGLLGYVLDTVAYIGECVREKKPLLPARVCRDIAPRRYHLLSA